ncbi:unnamed protein product [Phytophthora lilii]|uniref:Unnamed protein product n=1 Tax=Phytophthora lilii TaxID=2077276 RepID=A0A9W6YKY5_9STRA|nr:unnamed protein product [Phytophthora lilii]
MYRMQPTDFVLVSSVATLTASIRCRLNSMLKPQTTSCSGTISVLRPGTALSMLRSMVLNRFYPDAAQSTKYSSATATAGDGYSNNTAISTTFTAGTISATASVANDGFTKGLLSNPPNAGADSSTSWPSTGAASATTTLLINLSQCVLSLVPFAVSWGAVVNSLEPTIDGIYMPFTTSRLYVPFVHLENPQAIISKPVKKVRYNDCYAQWFYQRAGIGKQSTA